MLRNVWALSSYHVEIGIVEKNYYTVCHLGDCVDQVYKALGVKGKHRNIIEDGSSFCIKESYPPYNAHFAIKMDLLRVENTIRWGG